MSRYENKFQLSSEQELFLAKKKWDETIYCGMRMENRAVTFPQTKTILEGINVPGVRLDDIEAILNMRDAWKFLLSNLSAPIDFDFLCKINGFVSRNEALVWGELRTGTVSISGTDYIPPIPTREATEMDLLSLPGENATEKALNAFCTATRAQYFWDGNKRTSLLLANRILIDAGAGLLIIGESVMENFNRFLIQFYKTAEREELRGFLYDDCIKGLTLS